MKTQTKSARKLPCNAVRSEGLLLILIALFLIYLISLPVAVRWYAQNIPQGDGFTYATTFFSFLDWCHDNYFGALVSIFTSPWRYWGQPTLLAILSPIIVKEVYSVALINFAALGISTTVLFVVYHRITKSVGLSMLLALLFWFLPTIYGFPGAPDVNLLSATIDFIFVQALTVAVVTTINFGIEPKSRWAAVIAGVASGFAVWSRGNSPPYVLIALSCPLLFATAHVIRELRGKAGAWTNLRPIFLFSIVLIALTTWFYFFNFAAISRYYQASFSGGNLLGGGVQRALNSLNQYQDVFVRLVLGESRYQNHFPGQLRRPFYSLLPVALMIAMTFYSLRQRGGLPPERRRPVEIFALTGLTIYFGTFFFLTVALRVVLQDFGMAPFMPMIIGFELSLAAMILRIYFEGHFISDAPWKLRLIFGAVVIYAFLFTQIFVPLPHADALGTDGRSMEQFSLSIDRLAKPGKLAFLWYGVYNRSIVAFYQLKNSQPLYKPYENEFFDSLWTPNPNPDRSVMNNAFAKTFREADFIILPERIEAYDDGHVFPINLAREFFDDFLKSNGPFPFKIRERLKETTKINLLLLERVDPAQPCSDCEMFKWPLK